MNALAVRLVGSPAGREIEGTGPEHGLARRAARRRGAGVVLWFVMTAWLALAISATCQGLLPTPVPDGVYPVAGGASAAAAAVAPSPSGR